MRKGIRRHPTGDFPKKKGLPLTKNPIKVFLFPQTKAPIQHTTLF